MSTQLLGLMWPKEKQLLSGNIKIYRWKNSRDQSCQMTQHFTDEEPKPQEVILPTSQCLKSFVDLATRSVKRSHWATFLKHLLCDSGRGWFPAHNYSGHTHSCIASYSKHLQIFAWGLSVVAGICRTLPTSDDSLDITMLSHVVNLPAVLGGTLLPICFLEHHVLNFFNSMPHFSTLLVVFAGISSPIKPSFSVCFWRTKPKAVLESCP